MKRSEGNTWASFLRGAARIGSEGAGCHRLCCAASAGRCPSLGRSLGSTLGCSASTAWVVAWARAGPEEPGSEQSCCFEASAPLLYLNWRLELVMDPFLLFPA